ncbi:unnamed protein product [Meganyctiphanes norvegica]|uniref:Uncharacterized protein n=1 Tax=Meganyctiphanes norvegica TaxID=48144 RepID=A0AAV2QP72_MEGNR
MSLSNATLGQEAFYVFQPKNFTSRKCWVTTGCRMTFTSVSPRHSFGYDEVDPKTKLVVSEIFKMRNTCIIASTRPRSLANLACLVPVYKKAVKMQLLGIHPKHFKKYVEKNIGILMENKKESERERVCEELVDQLNLMITTLGTFLNSPMILNNLIQLYVENPEKMKNFSTTPTEVYEELRDFKIGKVVKRLEDKVDDPRRKIKKFMKIYDLVAANNFMNNNYELLSVEEVKELEEKCENDGIPHALVLSTFFATHIYKNKRKLETQYKYFHLTEQEFGCGKYLGMYIEKFIMNDSSQEEAKDLEVNKILEGNLFWKFLNSTIDEAELIKDKDQISRFNNVLFFLIGDLARRLPQSEKIFEKLSDKLIDIGWHLTDGIEWSNISYGEDDITESTEGDDIEADTNEDTESDTDEDIESDTDEDTGGDIESNTEIDNEVESDKSSKFGKEDVILRCLTESNMNDHILKSVKSKLSLNKSWHITKGESLLALNKVLMLIEPDEISISLDSDPSMFKDPLHATISKLTKSKKIENINFYFNSEYNGLSHGVTDHWIKEKIKITELIGGFGAIPNFNFLPTSLKSLHVRVVADYESLASLDKRLIKLHKLKELGIRLEIDREIDVDKLPKLSYPGDFLCLTLVCDDKNPDDNFGDEFASLLAQVARKLTPYTTNVQLRGVWLQNTSLTSEGISEVLTAMHKDGIIIKGLVKVWTSVSISPKDQENLDRQAKRYGLGGFQFYDICSSEGMMPKLVEKAKSDINTINADEAATITSMEQAASDISNAATIIKKVQKLMMQQ